MNILRNIYYDPSTGFQSKKKLYEAAKEKGITKQQVDYFLNNQEVYQLHKKPEVPKHYIPIIAKYPNEILQIDLLDISNLSSSNSGIHYILLAIDIFTRKVYVQPIKTKSAETVTRGFEQIIKETKPSKIQADHGKEFINTEFKNLLKLNNIELQLIDVGDHNKLGIINRFCRTIRELLNKYMTAYKTTRYIDVLDKLVANYNNSKHSTTLYSPNESIKHVNEIEKLNTIRYNKAIQNETHFKIGDKVRCIVNLQAFEKHSLPKWSKTIFDIIDKTEHAYTLSNNKTYKSYQLQLINNVFDVGLSTRTRAHQQIPTREELKIKNTTKRRLKKEDVSPSNIVQGKRQRKQTDRLKL